MEFSLPLSRKDRDYIEKMMIDSFLMSNSFDFAIALSRELGWPIYALTSGRWVHHAYLLSPNGIFYDARGPLNRRNMAKPFGISARPEKVSEDDLRRTSPINEDNVRIATKWAKLLWPHLFAAADEKKAAAA